jgi:hypothetical protein
VATNDLQQRSQRYFNLSSHFAQLDNAHLHGLFQESEAHTGWGRHHTIAIGRSNVFVKRIPITTIEYDNMFSTKNLYDLPTYYNYGVGSAGLGVFRELVTHIKTTNWVLAGAIATFPLLYHYRIIPFSGARADVDMERHAGYVEYWGNNPNIGRYLLDRANANYELVLFLEHFPHTVETWLLDNSSKVSMVIDDMRATITFLRKNGILHLDPHFFNVLTDGKRAYLADFGLVLDKHFVLTPAEEVFYRRNTHYDYGELLWSLGFHLFWAYHMLSDADKQVLIDQFKIAEGLEFKGLTYLLLDNADKLSAGGIIKIDASYVATIEKYWSIITLMHEFLADMHRNTRKDTRFQNTRLRRLLKETGFLPNTASPV